MRLAISFLVASSVGCVGDVGAPSGRRQGPADGSGAPGEGPEVLPDGSFACDPDAPTSVSPLRRLSAGQYRNTVRDLFAPAGVDAEAAAGDELARVPLDVGAFEIMDTRLSDQHARAYYRVADRLASLVAGDSATLASIAGDCALEPAPSASCVDAFLNDFGARAYRRPLSAEERAALGLLNDGSRDGRELFRALVFVMLQSPALVYHLELEGETVDGDESTLRLEAYELASRLSYHFWQSMPDAELLAAAADGSLLDEDGYENEVDRMIADPRTKETIASFYRQWWQIGWLTTFPATPGFATFAEGTTIGQPDADHLAAMADEIRSLAEYFTFAVDGNLRDLFLTDLSFTQSPHLAALYGVDAWDGESDYPRMPEGERAGLLTRAAMLLNDSHTTHPVHRGATIRRRILCQDLQPPDPATLPDGALTPPPVTADRTTRQRFEDKTREQPCAGCHQQINPIGFVLERYDSIGRYRDEERIIDEQTGEVLAVLPIDSSAAPAIGPGDPETISSGMELSREVVDSGEVEGCFARQYFRFTYAREELSGDGCTLESVRSILAGSGSLLEALRAIALDPAFRTRRFE